MQERESQTSACIEESEVLTSVATTFTFTFTFAADAVADRRVFPCVGFFAVTGDKQTDGRGWTNG